MKKSNSLPPSASARRIEAFPQNGFTGEFPDLGNVGWGRFSKAQPHMLYRHSHPAAFEICFIRRGTVIWQANNDIFTVDPGEVFITWPGEPHGGEGNTMHPCELYWIIFRLTPETGSFGLSPAETAAFDTALRTVSCRKFKVPGKITAHFDRILSSLSNPTPFTKAVVNASIQLIICDLLEADAFTCNSKKLTAHSPRIQKIITRLHAGISTGISVETIAKQIGLKSSHFRTIFRQETGFSPVEYLTLLRIQKAKNLLLQTTASVTDIAFDLGFSSSQYFASAFRKITGTTPREFRKLYSRPAISPRLKDPCELHRNPVATRRRRSD